MHQLETAAQTDHCWVSEELHRQREEIAFILTPYSVSTPRPYRERAVTDLQLNRDLVLCDSNLSSSD